MSAVRDLLGSHFSCSVLLKKIKGRIKGILVFIKNKLILINLYSIDGILIII
jgi:hypothetical protein